MKNIKIKNHFLSALAVSFFLFLAYSSDDADKNKTSENISQTETTHQSTSQEQQNSINETPQETKIELNTDSLLSWHIENLKAGCTVARQIMLSTDPTEIRRLRDEQEKIRANNVGNLNQIKDATFFRETYLDAYAKCVSILEQITNSSDDSEIENQIIDALTYATLASNALLYIQNPDLNYPRDKTKILIESYKSIRDAVADERTLKLPHLEFKETIIQALPNLKQSSTDLQNANL